MVVVLSVYLITGLRVGSEFAFPALSPLQVDDGATVDVVIEFREDIGRPEASRHSSEWFQAGERDFLFQAVPGLLFRITDGRRILISRASGIADQDVGLYLMGSAWGVLCHQRGLLPLHCSAVRHGDVAFALTGPSGAGKSTLAAGLANRGYAHLTDDTCVIDPVDPAMRMYPMPKGLKLCGDAVDALGLERGPPVSGFRRWDKFHVSLPDEGEASPAPVAAIYVLKWSDGDRVGIERMRGGVHFRELMTSVYRFEWLAMIRDPAEVFAHIAALSRGIQFFEFSRPRDLSRFDEGVRHLEAHLATLEHREFA